ncbi:MAG: PIN domain-containing protein [Actinophytocola sp.]|nr:PIN domain-containing protein [Actinophytocola sp.]
MIYLDTAALVKLVRREPESDTLADWLDRATDTDLVSSALCEVELPRALRRTEPELLAGVPPLLAHIARYAIDDLVRSTAASYTDQHLRTLDAIHLATAHGMFGPARITAFVTYDRQLLACAARWGLTTASPGSDT